MSGGIYTDRGCDPLCFPGLSGSFRDPSGMECLHGKCGAYNLSAVSSTEYGAMTAVIAAMAFWRHRAISFA